MDDFEKKYGFVEDKKRKAFHRGRIMFVIKDNRLFIAPKGVAYSHAVWFEREDWMKFNDDSFMNENVRGRVDPQGNIGFYVGYDFSVTEKAEKTFFKHLKEIVTKLNVQPTALVYGGLKKISDDSLGPAKNYGTVKELLKNVD
ncbi:hypothetical protein GOV04_02750 [Candidatus Woesearchaeota archaeon]|nr:hypothetical protein [Candidatus Woesearchaeota archaeon]